MQVLLPERDLAPEPERRQHEPGPARNCVPQARQKLVADVADAALHPVAGEPAFGHPGGLVADLGEGGEIGGAVDVEQGGRGRS